MGSQYSHLSQEDRDVIAVCNAQGFSARAIGRLIGRNGSTVSRELARNRSSCGRYLSSKAHRNAVIVKQEAGWRESKCEPFRDEIYYFLCLGWTPAQISGRLKVWIYRFKISYETIYRYIYQQHIDWTMLLARKHSPRWRWKMGRKHTKREMIPNRTCITQRPDYINSKRQFGHWEGDSIVCSQSVVSLNVMVERQTQYVSITRLNDRTPETTRKAMIASLKRFRSCGRKSITLDNGIEFKEHEHLRKQLKMKTYFCQAYHSWEKGLVEHVNGLIRRYLPKKTDLSTISDKEIKVIETLLNSRPRKMLNWKTPAEVFAQKCKMNMAGDALAI